MNQGFVTCLFASVAVGAIAGTTALAAGSGWLIALALYSATGSITLVVAAMATTPGEPHERHPLALLPAPSAPEPAAVYST